MTFYLGLRAINDEMALIRIAGIGKGKSKSTVANKENIEFQIAVISSFIDGFSKVIAQTIANG